MTRIEDMDLETVSFASDRLRFLSARSIEAFDSIVGTVDLSRVVGTMHGAYAGRTWGELKPVPGPLAGNIMDATVGGQPLARAIMRVRELERCPGYYLSTDIKEHWSFYRIDGDYYIDEGNNRSVIGRSFLFANGLPAVVHGVAITDAVFRAQDNPGGLGQGMWRHLTAKFVRLLGTDS